MFQKYIIILIAKTQQNWWEMVTERFCSEKVAVTTEETVSGSTVIK